MRDLETNIESIKNGHPRKVRIDHFSKHRTGDVFREQLLYALGGERKYSSEALADPSSLDCVWLLLRNSAIYF